VAWVQSKPIITAPIVGATKLHHLDDAIAALEEPYVPHEVVGFV
jgi:aryl-alcohol dehydrogenase-like predicted oxidoreductase